MDVGGKTEALKLYLTLAVLIIASVFFAVDIYDEFVSPHAGYWHTALEACVFIATIAALAFEFQRIMRLRRQVVIEHERAARLSGELHRHIEKAFERWHLTEAEREVAIMLIKGLSMMEIAAARAVKEKTVRQHATNIYAKAGCANRSELASLFIEDLINLELS